MKITIEVSTDELTPEKVARYLERQGWEKTHSRFVNDNPQLPVQQFRKKAEQRFPWEINFPMTKQLEDFEDSLKSAIGKLAMIEDRTEYEVYQDLLTA